MTLNIPPDLERRVAQEAERQGLPADNLLLKLLEEQFPPLGRNTTLAVMLQSWIDEGDAGEQRETFEALKRGLNETRSANGERIVFP